MNIICVKCGGKNVGIQLDASGTNTCFSCKTSWHKCTVHDTVVFKEAPSMNSKKQKCTCGQEEYPIVGRKAKHKAKKKIHKYYGYGVSDY